MKTQEQQTPVQPLLSNAAIADQLASLAQLLSTQKENLYKVKAYRRAAANIRTLSASLEELVKDNADLTRFPGIGEAIAGAIREIVLTGSLKKLELLRTQVTPEVATLSDYSRLDPKRVMRVYNKLKISSIEELRERLESGEIESALGRRMTQHIRQGLSQGHSMLLYKADDLCDAIEEFLVEECRVSTVQRVGACRRRVETIEEIAFIVQTDDFPAVIRKMEKYGGSTPLIESFKDRALFAHASGITLHIQAETAQKWGLRLIAATGSPAHLKKLEAITGKLPFSGRDAFPTEEHFYEHFGLDYIEPELREGFDEVDRARDHSLPQLVTKADIRGELHTHSTSSDGVHSIEQMAAAAKARGYEYIGISDHSQSLKIAGGVSIDNLWQQIRYIDKLNGKLSRLRVLKSAEVDILADGSLDYPDDLLRELDYAVCSIHSRFSLNREQQTERVMRAMDNRYFNILGHATGRLLLKRPGYELDIERVVEHARKNGCFFEINSSPDRLDLSAENARFASSAGLLIAVNTDAHSIGELALIRCGLDQARRAGLTKSAVLNSRPWQQLHALFKR